MALGAPLPPPPSVSIVAGAPISPVGMPSGPCFAARFPHLLRTHLPHVAARMSGQGWFAWAVTITSSRALTIRGDKYLVPFADMFNYEPHKVCGRGVLVAVRCTRFRILWMGSSCLLCRGYARCVCQEARSAEQGAHFLKHHVLSSSGMTIVADRDAAPGQQLFEDYGDNDNSMYGPCLPLFALGGHAFLCTRSFCVLCVFSLHGWTRGRYTHHHGFVARNNPFDCVAVSLPELKRKEACVMSRPSTPSLAGQDAECGLWGVDF